MAARSFLFVLGSSRPDGNTETLTRIAAEQLPTDTGQHWLSLRELPLPEFEDVRHPERRHAPPGGNAGTLLRATLDATDVVIASPLYWYSVSSSTKRYLDHWSHWLRTPGADFRRRMAGKTLWGSRPSRTATPRSPSRWRAPCGSRRSTWGCGGAGCCWAPAAARRRAVGHRRHHPGEDLLQLRHPGPRTPPEPRDRRTWETRAAIVASSWAGFRSTWR